MVRLRLSLGCAVICVVLAASTLLGACQPTPSPSATAINPPSTAVASQTTAETSAPSEGPPSAPSAAPNEPIEIVDRDGVPPELRDLWWSTSTGYAGALADTAQTHVPKDEYIVAVGEGLVVSARERLEDPDVRAELLVRKVGSDEAFLQTDTELTRVQAIIVRTDSDTWLFWAGLEGRGVGPEGASLVDGGVYAANLEAGFDPITVIVEPGAPLDKFGENAERAPLAVDPERHRVLSRVGGSLGVQTDVINADERVRVNQVNGRNEVVATRDVAVTYVEGDGGVPQLIATPLNGDGELWRFPTGKEGFGVFEVEAIVPLSSGVAVGYHRAGDGFNEWAITVLDIKVGDPRDILVESSELDVIHHLAAPLSNQALLALTPDFWDTSIQIGDAFSLLQPESGEFIPDAFKIVLK